MDEIKKKNYLKRNTFMNSVDSNKIWSKSMKAPEIKILLESIKIIMEVMAYLFIKTKKMDILH